MDGFIVIDKPKGITSHGVVSAVRRIAGQKKVGHTGTLDPFATGVLPVALGEGTKAIPFLDEQCKTYRAVMRLGTATDTQDCTGEAVRHGDWQSITVDDLERVAAGFRGSINQIPPMYSALKRDGVPLYRLARKGEDVERQARAIEVYELRLEAITFPDVTISVTCSRGTYVRTLAHDMGEALGCFAHLVDLRRLASGPFAIEQSLTLDALQELSGPGALERMLVSPLRALDNLRELRVDRAGAERVAQGRSPAGFIENETAFHACRAGEKVRLSYDGRLAAVAEVVAENGEDGMGLRIVRGFASFPFT